MTNRTIEARLFLGESKEEINKHIKKAVNNMKEDDGDDIIEASNNLYWLEGAMYMLSGLVHLVEDKQGYEEIQQMIQNISAEQVECDRLFDRAFHTRR